MSKHIIFEAMGMVWKLRASGRRNPHRAATKPGQYCRRHFFAHGS
jgi:hypothetical protein